MMRDLRILEVVMQTEGRAVTHQTLRLPHGRWAVAWESVPYAEGDYLPTEDVENPMLDHGAKLLATQHAAERLSRQLTHLRETTRLDEMLRVAQWMKDSTK